MIYNTNKKNGNKISRLSFGCMRFPKRGGRIDIDAATEMVKTAVGCGINYFDAAYIYPGIEKALSEALVRTSLRKKVYIATKLPLMLIKNAGDFDKFFDKQKKRLQTDYIDYYLMHMLCDLQTWEKLVSLGILSWIENKKAAGEIINIGFSYHGGQTEFIKIIDAYNWDFCMIQYNYIDENNQAGKNGLSYAKEKNIPVFIMEPLRGSMLADGLPPKCKTIFATADSSRTPPQWAFRWLWSQEEITSVLSGMESIEQIKQNSADASEASTELSEDEKAVYINVVKEWNKSVKIPCTACGYCAPCPFDADIQTCFSSYNESYTSGFYRGFRNYFMNTGGIASKNTGAKNCTGCRKCEKNCPQNIKISAEMKKVKKRFEKPLLRLLGKTVKIYFKLKY